MGSSDTNLRTRFRITPSEGKLSIFEMMSLFFVNTGITPGLSLIQMYLLIFYTDIVGLDPAKIGTLFLVARVFDGFNDPVQGYIIDHLPKTKMGRFRPYLIIASFLFSANFTLVFFGPLWASSGAKMAIAWVTYLMIDMTYSFADIPNNCLLPVMTDNPKERNILTVFKGMGITVGNMLVSLPLPILLDRMPDNKLQAYSLFLGVSAAVTVLCISFGALGVKERIPAEEEQKYGIRELFSILTQRPVFALFLAQLLGGIGAGSSSVSQLYFFTYVLKDVKFISYYALLAVIVGGPGVMTSPLIANRFGKRASYTMGMSLIVAGGFMRLINVTSKPLLFVSHAIFTYGSSISQPLVYAIMADNTDYIEYTQDKRAEGAVASLSTLVNKAGGGLGNALAGYILKATGYVANAENQTQRAQNGIVLVAMLFPAICNLFAVLFFRFLYPLTVSKMQEITQTLQERRVARDEIAAETVDS